jgi:hypothetical protein
MMRLMDSDRGTNVRHGYVKFIGWNDSLRQLEKCNFVVWYIILHYNLENL